MCLCDFWGTVNTGIFADLLSVGLGEKVTAEELDQAGERIWNLLRLINQREGFSGQDDTLPSKILETPLEKGPHDGHRLTADDLAKMKKLYYFLRGWDETGRPTPEKLRQLGLDRME
jgi:aldehyde:ferredoxin oxidoreductase